MSEGRGEFYQVGGNISQESPCYVRRRADSELVAALSEGDFCYVLTARQMGKSSLMVRAAAQLRAEKVAVAVIDLQSLGQNTTVSQWYGQMVREIAEQLGLEDEIETFCLESGFMSPLQQWRAVLREIALRWSPTPVVLFIDEIDYVRSLVFRTDEFFAAIREFYNRRSEEPLLRRLAFCLLGVATPADLIHDARLTPFNIGRRIELTDFTPSEAAPLADGLGRSAFTEKHGSKFYGNPDPDFGHPDARNRNRRLLERILHWTGGHPYLTQKLCRAVAREQGVNGPAGVDRVCADWFFSVEASREESNLQFVSSRLLQSGTDLADLLGIYTQVLNGIRIFDSDSDSRISVLKLSGIVRSERGRLVCRNRIYRRVFGPTWARNHLPNADVRRQRTAYLRGALRTGGVLGAFLTVTGLLALIALQQAQIARRATSGERAQREAVERVLYADDMNIAQEAWKEGLTARTVELLQSHVPAEGGPDPRGFEWGVLWRLTHRDLRTLSGHRDLILSVAVSPDGKYVASGGFDGLLKVWDIATGAERASITAHRSWIYSIAFSPDGRRLLSAGQDGLVRIWSVPTFIQERQPIVPGGMVTRIAFSRDGGALATASGTDHARVTIWSTKDWRAGPPMTGHRAEIYGLAFSANGSRLITTSHDGTARLWDVERHHQIRSRAASVVYDALFSPDGKTIVTAWHGKQIEFWDAGTLVTRRTLKGHAEVVHRLAFSPDGRTLASASWDYTARLWDAASGNPLGVVRGHTDKVNAVAFSPDGRTLATCSNDRTVKLWRLPLVPEVTTLANSPGQFAFQHHGHRLVIVDRAGKIGSLWDPDGGRRFRLHRFGRSQDSLYALSDDGQLAAYVGAHSDVHLWNLEQGREQSALIENDQEHLQSVRCVAFSARSEMVACGCEDGKISLWDTSTGSLQRVVSASRSAIIAVAFSPDGGTIVSGGADNTARLWNVSTGSEIGALAPTTGGASHTNNVNAVVFSPDGRVVATASWDTTVKLWNASTRAEIGVLRGHLSSVEFLAFTPDSRTLATASLDKTARLWNVATLRETGVIRDVDPAPLSLRFSSDGTCLAVRRADDCLCVLKSAQVLR